MYLCKLNYSFSIHNLVTVRIFLHGFMFPTPEKSNQTLINLDSCLSVGNAHSVFVCFSQESECTVFEEAFYSIAKEAKLNYFHLHHHCVSNMWNPCQIHISALMLIDFPHFSIERNREKAALYLRAKSECKELIII